MQNRVTIVFESEVLKFNIFTDESEHYRNIPPYHLWGG